MKKILIMALWAVLAQCVFATVRPRSGGINEGNKHTFDNGYVSAKFDPATTDLELTFKQDSENMNILIYKNGKVCEKETLPNVAKDDTERYCLSDYGTGVYTICTGENRQMQILGTVVCGE